MIEITSTEMFKKKVLESDEVVMVEFYTTDCPACKALKPKLDKVGEELNIWVYGVDCEKCDELILDYNIMSVPTVMTFEKGFMINSHSGSIGDLEQIKKLLI